VLAVLAPSGLGVGDRGQGVTPLHEAARCNCPGNVTLLLTLGRAFGGFDCADLSRAGGLPGMRVDERDKVIKGV
jgi:hypothetical protein